MTPEQLEAVIGQYAHELMIETQRRIMAEVSLAAAQKQIVKLEAANAVTPADGTPG